MSGSDFCTTSDLYSSHLIKTLLNAHRRTEKWLLREHFGLHSGFIVLSEDDAVNADNDSKRARLASDMKTLSSRIRNINTIYYPRTKRDMVVKVRGLFDTAHPVVSSGSKSNKGSKSTASNLIFRKPKQINWERYISDIETMMRSILNEDSFKLPEDMFQAEISQEKIENNKIYTSESLYRLDSRNYQPILQKTWSKTIPLLREYENLDEYVVSANVSGVDGDQVMRQLSTQLPNGFTHQPYDYDDMELTEQWMQSFKMDDGKGGAADAAGGGANVITRGDVENCVISSHLDMMIVKVIDRVFNELTKLSDPPWHSKGFMVERQVFGLDCYTRRMAELAIEDRVSEGCYSRDRAVHFIERRLLPALNGSSELDEGCFDLSRALDRILQSGRVSPLDAVYATAVQEGIADLPSGSLKVHCKGTGVLCSAEGGVGPYTVVCDYVGELYPPYRWIERLDVIEQAQRHFGLKPSLPEFYNIILEKPSIDPNGYYLFYVDACDKGNVGSTLSHSCNPNCESSVVSRNGKLSIALTSNRSIAEGEEITHDYHCVTTSESEYEAAICLCGMCNCRGSFLHLAVDEDIQQVVIKRFGPAIRYAHLLRACSGKPLTLAEEQILDRFGIKNATLGAHPPLWLRKIAAEYLKFIEFERKALPMALLRNESDGRGRRGGGFTSRKRDATVAKFASVEIEARVTMENRIQSLVCCLSSINKVLTVQNTEKRNMTPVRLLPQAIAIDIVFDFFADIERCLRVHLLPNIHETVKNDKKGAIPEAVSEPTKGGGSKKRRKEAPPPSSKKGSIMVAKNKGLLEQAMGALRALCEREKRPKTINDYRDRCNDVVAVLASIRPLELPQARLSMLIDVVILYKHTSNFSSFAEYVPYSSDPIHLRPRDFCYEPYSCDKSVGKKVDPRQKIADKQRVDPRARAGAQRGPGKAQPAEEGVEGGFVGSKRYEADYIFWQILSFYRASNFDEAAHSAVDLSGGVQLPLPSQCFGECDAAGSARASGALYGNKQRSALIEYLRDEKGHSLPLPRGVRDCLSTVEAGSCSGALAVDTDGCAIRALHGSPILDNTLGQTSSLRNVLVDLLPNSYCKAFLGRQLNFDQQQLDMLLPPEDNCDWVQCHKCHKWRRVRFDVDAEALPEEWECSMNFWEATEGCAAPEDAWDMDREAVMGVRAADSEDAQRGLLEVGAERDVFCPEMRVYYEAAVVQVRMPPPEGEELPIEDAPKKSAPRAKSSIPNFHPGKRKRKKEERAPSPARRVPKVKFHFKGWDDEWDEWIYHDSPRIAPLHLYTNSQLSLPEEQEIWQQRGNG